MSTKAVFIVMGIFVVCCFISYLYPPFGIMIGIALFGVAPLIATFFDNHPACIENANEQDGQD